MLHISRSGESSLTVRTLTLIGLNTVKLKFQLFVSVLVSFALNILMLVSVLVLLPIFVLVSVSFAYIIFVLVLALVFHLLQ